MRKFRVRTVLSVDHKSLPDRLPRFLRDSMYLCLQSFWDALKQEREYEEDAAAISILFGLQPLADTIIRGVLASFTQNVIDQSHERFKRLEISAQRLAYGLIEEWYAFQPLDLNPIQACTVNGDWQIKKCLDFIKSARMIQQTGHAKGKEAQNEGL